MWCQNWESSRHRKADTNTAREEKNVQAGEAAGDTPTSSYLFYEVPGQKVLHKLPQVFLGDSVVEEGYFPVDEPQQGGRAVCAQVVGEAPLIPSVDHADSHS